MKTKRKVCWNIVSKCNQNCLYCHRFLNIKELSYEENEKILNKLIKDGVTHITWTGGEPLLYPNLYKLIKISKEKGVYNRIITNGKLLSENYDILNYLSDLTLSLDSIDNKTNVLLGRGEKHFETIKSILNYIQNGKFKNLKVNVNTVVNRQNLNDINELGEFLNKYKITIWKLYKFMPLRETAEKNKELFEITDNEFDNVFKSVYEKYENINSVIFKKQKEIEKDILILANGNIIKTENDVDIVVGNILKENFADILKKSEQNSIFANTLKKFKENETVNKIRTFVAYNDKKVRDVIINTIKTLDFADVVESAENGRNTYNRIVELQPDMVFAEYHMSDMNGVELIKKSKEKLENETPIFNMIIDNNIEEEKIDKMYEIIGNKLNSLIIDPVEENIIDIMNEYKEYKDNLNKK